MNLPRATPGYSAEDQDRTRRAIEQADVENRKTGQDVEAVGGQRIIIPSPNGLRWALSASNAGVLTLVAA